MADPHFRPGDDDPAGGSDRAGRTDRATTAAVEKTFEAAIVVLFVGVLATTLHAGVAPAYERVAGEDVADRVLIAASDEIERAAPPHRPGTERHDFELERRVELPARIASGSYRLTAEGSTLRLVHPELDLVATTPLAVPSFVEDVTGTWRGGAETVLVIESDRDGGTIAVTIRLVNR